MVDLAGQVSVGAGALWLLDLEALEHISVEGGCFASEYVKRNRRVAFIRRLVHEIGRCGDELEAANEEGALDRRYRYQRSSSYCATGHTGSAFDGTCVSRCPPTAVAALADAPAEALLPSGRVLPGRQPQPHR